MFCMAQMFFLLTYLKATILPAYSCNFFGFLVGHQILVPPSRRQERDRKGQILVSVVKFILQSVFWRWVIYEKVCQPTIWFWTTYYLVRYRISIKFGIEAVFYWYFTCYWHIYERKDDCLKSWKNIGRN